MLLITSTKVVQAADPFPIQVYHAIYAMEFTTDTSGQLFWIINNIPQKQPEPAAALIKTVFVLTGKTSTDLLPQSEKTRTFMVAREAYFRASNEEPITGAVPMYLLDANWAPCRGQAKTQSVISPGLPAQEKKTSASHALILEGCATHPNRYASLVVAGGGISEISWIDDRPLIEKPAYERPPNYYQGMTKELRELDEKLQQQYKREDEEKMNRMGEGTAREIRAMNDMLEKASVKVAPISPAKKKISIGDARIQPFIIATANEVNFKDFKPILFVARADHYLVLFRHISQRILKLTEINKGHLRTVQTQTESW